MSAEFQTAHYQATHKKRPYGYADWLFIPVAVDPAYANERVSVTDAIALRTPLPASANGRIGYTEAKRAIQRQYPAVTIWMVTSGVSA